MKAGGCHTGRYLCRQNTSIISESSVNHPALELFTHQLVNPPCGLNKRGPQIMHILRIRELVRGCRQSAQGHRQSVLELSLNPRQSGSFVLYFNHCSMACHMPTSRYLVTGEGNGNPLQCSCLENPTDRGAWCAAVSGVAQSQIRLKRLSNSSRRNKSGCHRVCE